MDYIDRQFNKIFNTKGEALSLKIHAESGNTNWLNITEHEYDELIAPRLEIVIGYLRNKQFLRDQINNLEGA